MAKNPVAQAADSKLPRRVLVATFSGSPALKSFEGRPALLRYLIERSNPELIVLLATSRSYNDAVTAVTAFASWGLSAVPVEVRLVPADEFDPEAVRAVLDELARRGYEPDQIVIDGTGATSIMSVSAYIAASAAGVDFQGVRQDQGTVAVLRNSAEEGS